MQTSFLLDTHAHSDAFEVSVWAEVVERALARGVRGNLSAGVWWDQFERLMNQFKPWLVPRLGSADDLSAHLLNSERYAVLASIGLHPMEIAVRWVDASGKFDRTRAHLDVEEFKRSAQRHAPWIWAVGETGFDLSKDVHRSWCDKGELQSAQSFGFSACVDLAVELGLPLIIHSRSAWQATQNAVSAARMSGLQRFMVHCYSGPAEGLKWLEQCGGFASFGGVTTWPDAKKVHHNVSVCPSSVILFETDSPDMPPCLTDGRRPELNEPGYLPVVVEKASQLRGQTPAELVDVNRSNFLRFIFGSPV